MIRLLNKRINIMLKKECLNDNKTMTINVNTFIPFYGTDMIAFGEERNNIREKLNLEYKEYLENEFAENTTDYFESLGLFIEYDHNNKCNAMVFEETLFYEGINLMDLSFSRLKEIYDIRSTQREVEEEIGITYYDLGFGANKVFSRDEIQTIIIFSRDYWDNI